MTKLRQATALAVVEIERTTFENAVAKGEYTSMPPTTRGTARLFAPDDLIPLWIFARLIEARGDHSRERMSLKEAGKVVRRIHDAILEAPNGNHVVVITGVNDQIRAHPLTSVNDLTGVISSGVWSGSVIRDIRVWHIRNIRQVIEKSIAALGEAAGE